MQKIDSRRSFIAAACMALALSALCAMTAASAFAAGAQSGQPAAAQIDINSASAEQLTAIPGIGQVMAQRIVQFREEQGPFKRVEDLLKIKGIGEKSFQRIRPYVRIGKSE